MTPASHAVYAYVKKHPGAAMNEVGKAIGMPRRTVYEAVKQLARDGKMRVGKTMRDTRLRILYTVE